MSVATHAHRGGCKDSPLTRLPRMRLPRRSSSLVLVVVLAACGAPRIRDGDRTLAPQRLMRRPSSVAPGRLVRVHGMLQLFAFGGALAGGWTGPRDGESRMNEGGLAIGLLLRAVMGFAVERRTRYWQQVFPCPDGCAVPGR